MTGAGSTQMICPDCSVEVPMSELRGADARGHLDACPVLVEARRTWVDDDAWFDAHPGHNRFRPSDRAERMAMAVALGEPLFVRFRSTLTIVFRQPTGVHTVVASWATPDHTAPSTIGKES